MSQKPTPSSTLTRALRLGVAGPVGTGKSSLIATICRALADELSIAVITNDIYTDEDARLLRSAGVLPAERIRAVETGACPHTAIRDDITMNLLAVEDLERDFDPVDLVLVESGGDNLTATFSPALVDAQIFRPRRRRRRRRRPQRRPRHSSRRPPRHQQDRPGSSR